MSSKLRVIGSAVVIAVAVWVAVVVLLLAAILKPARETAYGIAVIVLFGLQLVVTVVVAGRDRRIAGGVLAVVLGPVIMAAFLLAIDDPQDRSRSAAASAARDRMVAGVLATSRRLVVATMIDRSVTVVGDPTGELRTAVRHAREQLVACVARLAPAAHVATTVELMRDRTIRHVLLIGPSADVPFDKCVVATLGSLPAPPAVAIDCPGLVGPAVDRMSEAPLATAAGNPNMIGVLTRAAARTKQQLTQQCAAGTWSADAIACIAHVNTDADYQRREQLLAPVPGRVTIQLTAP